MGDEYQFLVSGILREAITLTDYVIKSSSITRSEILSLIDSVIASIIGSNSEQTFFETVDLLDDVYKLQQMYMSDSIPITILETKDFQKLMQDTSELLDAVTKNYGTTKNEALTLSSVVIKTIRQNYAEVISLIQDTMFGSSISYEELLNTSDLVRFSWVSYAYMFDSIDMFDSIRKAFSTNKVDILSISDFLDTSKLLAVLVRALLRENVVKATLRNPIQEARRRVLVRATLRRLYVTAVVRNSIIRATNR